MGEDQNVFLAAGQGNSLWIQPRTFDKRFAGQFINIIGRSVTLLGGSFDWPPGQILGFDATPNMAAVVTSSSSDDRVYLAIFWNWNETINRTLN